MIVSLIAAAAIAQAGSFADRDAGRIAFTLVDPASGSAIAFDRSEPRYALVRLEPAGAGPERARPLDRPNAFSRLQSTTVVSRPPGWYAVVEVAPNTEGFVITPGASSAPARFNLAEGGWISVTCAADGPARCTSSRDRMMSVFR